MATQMTTKAPTAEEVLALVTAASASEPTMQQLLLQVQQAQQAQLLAAADMGPTGHSHADEAAAAAAAATAAMELMTAHGVGMDTATSMAAAMAPPMTVNVSPQMSAVAAAAVASVAGSPSSSRVGANVATSGGAIRRKSIPLSMKKEAIEWIMGPGKGIPSRAEKHFSALNWDVSASSFRKWWKNRDKIMNDSSTKKRISGGGRKPYLDESEEKLLVIVIQERAKKDRVTRKWIAKTAQHMFQRINNSFKASENWVTKFIRRNGLTLKRSYITYEDGPPGMVDGSGAGGMVLPPGTIEVHDDDDDDDDDDDTEQDHQVPVDRAPTDAIVV